MSDLDLGIPFNDAPPRSRSARHRRRRRKEGGRSAAAFVVMILVFGLLAGGAWYGYGKVRDFLTTPDYVGGGVGTISIEVADGETASDIASTLFKADVVKSSKAFVEAASADSRALAIQPGTYVLHKQMSASAALTMMLDPASKEASNTFLITEGLTVKEILPKIAQKTGVPLAEFEAAVKDPAGLGVPAWARRSSAEPLIIEGFLFPAKYEFGPKDDAKTILSRMVAQTVKVMQGDGFIQAAQALGRSPLELLTIASLVQSEGTEQDFAKVSRVVYNRLAEKQGALRYLQFDSTTQYWLITSGQGRKKFVTEVQLKDPRNDYSTHLDRLIGLPPTPISQPGKAAIDAAAHPVDGNWTYFVVTEEDGTSSFTNKLSEHEANVVKCKKIKRC